MEQVKKQKDVQDYFVRHATRFDGLYGGDNAATRLFDKWFRKPMYARYVYTLEDLLPGKGKSYLDLGCGSGRYAVALAGAGARVTGLDFSPAMLALASKFATETGSQNSTEFIQTDINEWMQTTKMRFDASYAMGVFDYLNNPVHTLKLMLNVSDSALISVPSPTFPRSQIRTFRYKLQDCPVFYFKKADVEKLFADAGGQITEIKSLGNAGFWVKGRKA